MYSQARVTISRSAALRGFSTGAAGLNDDGIMLCLFSVGCIGTTFGASFMAAGKDTPVPCSEKAPTQTAQFERTN